MFLSFLNHLNQAKRVNVWNDWNKPGVWSDDTLFLSRWQRRRSGEGLEQFDQFGIARRISNGSGQILRRQGTRVIADDLSVFAMKLGIFESLAHRLLNDSPHDP